MNDLRQLYQEVIFDHNRSPRNFGRLEHPTHQAEGINPLCGDALTVYLMLDKDNRIETVCFEGQGCDAFHALATGDTPPATGLELSKLEVLSGVQEYPARVKCATLAWHAVHSALHNRGTKVTTE